MNKEPIGCCDACYHRPSGQCGDNFCPCHTMNKEKKRKKPFERRVDRAINKAFFALRGMLHIPTTEAIKHFLLNPKDTP